MTATDSTHLLSTELGTPLEATSFTLDDLNATLRRERQAVLTALVWTREYWKWFLPKYDEGNRAGHNSDIWYSDAIRKLHRAIADIDTEAGMYADPDGIDPEWAGLVAAAFEFYQEYYHPLRKGPEQHSAPRSYT